MTHPNWPKNGHLHGLGQYEWSFFQIWHCIKNKNGTGSILVPIFYIDPTVIIQPKNICFAFDLVGNCGKMKQRESKIVYIDNKTGL